MAQVTWPSGSPRLKEKQTRDADAAKRAHDAARDRARANPSPTKTTRRGPMYDRSGRGRGK